MNDDIVSTEEIAGGLLVKARESLRNDLPAEALHYIAAGLPPHPTPKEDS